jgi:hypothetical protein
MGTLCMPTPPEGRQAYLDHQMNTISNGRLVKSAQVGGAYYAAVEINNPETAAEPFLFAVVCISTLHAGGSEFCYKDMEESMGPAHHLEKCPVGILNCLTPIDQLKDLGVYTAEQAERAENWRSACFSYARRARTRLQAGDRVRLRKPVRFEGGLEAANFVKVAIRGRRGLFRVEDSDELVRLPSSLLRDAEIVR